MTNTNPETGIRYGIVSANSLDPEVICDLQAVGRDVHWEMALEDLKKEIEHEVNQGLLELEDADDEYSIREERLGDSFYDDEPVHEFQRDGVRGQTTWLGGALLVWVFHSPFISTFKLCSPCVPNCASLDQPDPNGFEGYTVPPDWLAEPQNG